MKVLKSTLAIVSAAAVLGVSGFAHAGATLDAVQKKGFVQCGVRGVQRLAGAQPVPATAIRLQQRRRAAVSN